MNGSVLSPGSANPDNAQPCADRKSQPPLKGCETSQISSACRHTLHPFRASKRPAIHLRAAVHVLLAHHRASLRPQKEKVMKSFPVLLGILVAVILAAPAKASAQSGITDRSRNSVTCASDDGRRHYCSVNTRGGVQMVNQRSGSPCVQGQTWGYDNRGIWVDRGCRADFALNGSGGRPGDGNFRPGNGGYPGNGSPAMATQATAPIPAMAAEMVPSLPVPPTTVAATTATLPPVVVSPSSTSAAAHHASRAKPGATPATASGSTAAAAQISLSAANLKHCRSPPAVKQ